MDYQHQGDKVVYNEGLAITYRLDEIQKQITLCSLNPGAMNPVFQEFNYKLWLRFLTAFQREISADLRKKVKGKTELDTSEEDDAEKLRTAIIKFDKAFPVYKNIKLTVPPYTTKLKLDERSLALIIEKLNDYGTYLNTLKKKHGYGNPTAEYAGGVMMS